MHITNQSRKVIGIAGEPLLPGDTKEIPEEYINHPSIQEYVKKGVVSTDQVVTAPFVIHEISDAKKEEIEKAAIARYLAEQQTKQTQSETGTIKSTKKSESSKKAKPVEATVTNESTEDQLEEKDIQELTV